MKIKILYYNDLDYHKVKKPFEKVVQQLERGDFISSEVKKMAPGNFFRARIDKDSRLLFKFARINGETYILLLEVILHHQYEKSRFLRGAQIDEDKLVGIQKPEDIETTVLEPVTFVNKTTAGFHLLDKVISFDDDQATIFKLPTPLTIIGSAGSGKTALTLEKIKTLRGRIMYVTLSPYLVENSSNLYYSFNYENESQDIDFLSFKDFVQTIETLDGREITFREFEGWFQRHRGNTKIKDAHKLFEEFRGVLTGLNIEKPYLSKEDYENLGVRQSVFLADERLHVYQLFEKYLQHLKENRYYDMNIEAYFRLEKVDPMYDFVIIDEVQDLTNVQLYLILKALHRSSAFILCGDSNQIVHPNFFSWANLKTMFYTSSVTDGAQMQVLKTNYRNSPEVTEIANRLLKIKNLRFGSIDRESTFLVSSISSKVGKVIYLEDTPKIKQDLNSRTKQSTRFAVLVMNNADKAEVRKFFQTPLLFSIQEAKGLEYENIILINFISNNSAPFREISEGITSDDIDSTEELAYSRAKDKTDKSLDVYKFYVNALYVAITRAVQNLYVVELNRKHELLNLLGLIQTRQGVDIQAQTSSAQDWQREAAKLEQQGKMEQAELIKQNILKIQKPAWETITFNEVQELKISALDPNSFNKKAKSRLFLYAMYYEDIKLLQALSNLKFRDADSWKEKRIVYIRKNYAIYQKDDVEALKKILAMYGNEFRDELNLTPLMAALQEGAMKIIQMLLDENVTTKNHDCIGNTPFQIMLKNWYNTSGYKKKMGYSFFKRLMPDHVKIRVDKHLIKIDARKAEFLLLYILIAAQTKIIRPKYMAERGIRADDLVELLEDYPDDIIPDYRKRKQYIGAMLAKNECNSKAPYNRKLFLRRSLGIYVLNPDLEVLIDEDNWTNVYDIMREFKLYLLPAYRIILKEIDFNYIPESPDEFDLEVEYFRQEIKVTKMQARISPTLDRNYRIIYKLDGNGKIVNAFYQHVMKATLQVPKKPVVWLGINGWDGQTDYEVEVDLSKGKYAYIKVIN